MILATRSDDAVQYAASHRLGLAVSYDPLDLMATVTDKYYQWCQEAGCSPHLTRSSIVPVSCLQRQQDT